MGNFEELVLDLSGWILFQSRLNSTEALGKTKIWGLSNEFIVPTFSNLVIWY